MSHPDPTVAAVVQALDARLRPLKDKPPFRPKAAPAGPAVGVHGAAKAPPVPRPRKPRPDRSTVLRVEAHPHAVRVVLVPTKAARDAAPALLAAELANGVAGLPVHVVQRRAVILRGVDPAKASPPPPAAPPIRAQPVTPS